MTKTTKTTTKTTAKQAYANAHRDAREMLAKIAHHLAAHRDAYAHDEISWGAVGDIQSAHARLQEIANFLDLGDDA